MKIEPFQLLEKKACEESITFEDALSLLQTDRSGFFSLIASADRIRRKYKGNYISLCSIINAKSGKCAEDCAFCAQSSHHHTDIQEYPLVGDESIVSAAKEASRLDIHKFGIVTSGKGIQDESEMRRICSAVAQVSQRMHCCASLGVLDKKTAEHLKNAGLKEYHHNLETSRSFFPKICSTHSYDDNVNTVKIVKEVGMRVCCGGIFGMGESLEQRVELAFTLKELDVDSIPLNFLNPVPGTRLEKVSPLAPLDILKIIAMFRFVHPEKDIKVAGGREVNLRDLQSFIFAAGANSTMLGNYLTTTGRKAEDDLQMIKDLQLEIRS